MSSKKKKIHVTKPIDAIRELFEDQQVQINELTETVKKQQEEIRTLKAKWNAKESLEREKQKEADSSWFFASRTSD
tara:strand:- start:106 stop:333 length:228 start_codon:yes stop_codon:yes gene_type:complete